MPEISLSNSKGRDAQVVADSVRRSAQHRYLDASGRQVTSVRLMKGSIDHDAAALAAQFGADKVGEALIAGDPELDIESVGRFLRDTSRVFHNTERKIVHAVTQLEIVRGTDGAEKARRPKKVTLPNISPEQPLLWSGKLIPKKEAFRKFVMASKLQLIHINGLTYDFLFDIAKDLESKDSLLLMGAGPKSRDMLILRRGATPYRGFLEGRTRGEEYCLILHLSNMELKAPIAEDAAS